MKYIFYITLVVVMASCCSSKHTSSVITLDQSESIHHERIVETVYDTVSVVIPIPEQFFESVRLDSISHLETDFAESDAWINDDGSLGHSIKSKPPDMPVNVPVASTNTTEIRVRELVKRVREPYPVEKKLTLWQSIAIKSFWYLIAVIAISLGWIFRKPIGFVFRKLF